MDRLGHVVITMRGRPVTGEALSPAERMRRYRARRRAAGFRAVTRYEVPRRWSLTASELDRRLVNARNLVLHCVAAKKIERDRTLLEKVRKRLDYWRRNSATAHPLAKLDEWEEILSRPWPAIALFITDPGTDAAPLRHVSPFEIVLSPTERRRIHSAFPIYRNA